MKTKERIVLTEEMFAVFDNKVISVYKTKHIIPQILKICIWFLIVLTHIYRMFSE